MGATILFLGLVLAVGGELPAAFVFARQVTAVSTPAPGPVPWNSRLLVARGGAVWWVQP
ncbi:MAG: hypothetical protein NZ869_00990 [Thermoanaerobaculum sp.]|nr:hypothetical protein [Thermoanaerobaculum sp.]MDW7968743.1 hypothetical protein [Thermoanaerobaculum sp.]